jgi:hypothetical protein
MGRNPINSSRNYDVVVASRRAALPHMHDAHRRVWAEDVGMERFIPRAQ